MRQNTFTRVTVLFGVLVALAASACASLRTAEGEQALRVMSYNIQYGGGGKNLDSVIGVIRAAHPDIVGLQEVDVHWSARSDFADQARRVADALGMEMRYAPIYDVPDSSGAGPPRQFGVALLSRYPITRFENHQLTRLSTQDSNPVPRMQPGLLDVTIDVRGTPLRVFNTHLDYRGDPAVRRLQVADIMALLGASRAPGAPRAPTLFLGDLNASPHSAELAPLFTVLHDSWPDSAGPGFTIPSDVPSNRIDYVLISDGIRVRRAWVPASTASDHRPMVVDLVVPTGGR